MVFSPLIVRKHNGKSNVKMQQTFSKLNTNNVVGFVNKTRSI